MCLYKMGMVFHLKNSLKLLNDKYEIMITHDENNLSMVNYKINLVNGTII